jgi:LL-diaminopimelate aminotransferase
MSINIKKAKRLEELPPYLFAELDHKKQELIKKGMDIINLGVGDPDQPTPEHIIEELYKASQNPATHQYATYAGMPSLREAIANWYEKRFGVELDHEKEVLVLIGSKEGIGHIPLAFVNPGDVVLVPDPGYPVDKAGTVFADGVPYYMPLLKENEFLPDLEAIDPQIARHARMMFINYPNNPTAACCDINFFEKVIAFAKEPNIMVCHDAAYSEIAYDGYEAPSFLQAYGAKEVGIEFHSLSKTYNMTGWRIGFAVGNREIIEGLGLIKTNLDSGIFKAVQFAGIVALTGPQENITRMCKIYQARRDALVDGLNSLGWKVPKPRATFYVWVPVPSGYTSRELVATLLEKAGILATPGIGFGENGEGYIRFSLTVDDKRLAEAVKRIKNIRM